MNPATSSLELDSSPDEAPLENPGAFGRESMASAIGDFGRSGCAIDDVADKANKTRPVKAATFVEDIRKLERARAIVKKNSLIACSSAT